MRGNSILLFMVLWPMIGAIASYIIGRFSKSARNTAVFRSGWRCTDFSWV